MEKYHKTDIAPVEQENERDETYQASNPQIDCTRTGGNYHIVKRQRSYTQFINDKMRETRMKGKFTGGRVNYVYSCHEQKLSVIDEEAAVLLEIFTDYANGKSLTDIANDLNARGITNRGKPFLMNTIYFLLNNEKYTGVYRFGDKVFTETYPQIIPVDLYKTVKTKLDANRHGKHVTGVEYLLRGKVRCGYCGKNLRSHAGMSSSGIYRYYECLSPRKTTNCKFRAVTKEILFYYPKQN